MARNDNNTAAPSGSEAEGGTSIKSVITSTLTIAIVAGIAVGLYRGMSPLEDRAVAIIGARAPKVDMRWPSLGGGADTRAAQTQGGEGPVSALMSVSSTVLPDAPTWLPRQMQEEIIAMAERNLDRSASPLSMDPLQRVGTAMELSGWFDGRPLVRREAGGRIAVAGNWRVPGAVIREGGKDYMISWDGKPMPVTYDAGEAQLPVITGVSIKPPSGGAAMDYTKSWPGDDVQAALELLRVIQGKPWTKQIAAIDVRAFEKDRTLSIVTTGGGRLNWGGRPNKPRLGEAGTASKIATIEWLQKRFGSIDAAGRTIDIFWQGRPLEIDVSASAGAPSGDIQTSGFPTSPLPPA